jgi:probable rRNA maturation factor
MVVATVPLRRTSCPPTKQKRSTREIRELESGRRVPVWEPSCFAFCASLTMIVIRKPVAGLSAVALARFVTRAQRSTGLRGSVDVLLVGNRELRALNRRFRGKNLPTDVLSFPAADSPRNSFAGDIAISVDIAKKNARRLGHATAEEIKILCLHGLLHLAGFDHERDQGQMARKERSLRRSLGLALGLTERSSTATRPSR